jgi:hypothetical protein
METTADHSDRREQPANFISRKLTQRREQTG